jgi:uncharacterized alkaline shock family protein YloU
MPGKVKARKDTMTSELRLEGLDVAPGVIETIITLAAQEVDGVVSVDVQGLAGLMQKAGRPGPVEVSLADDGTFAVVVHATVAYGRPLREIASDIQRSVADALLSQTGHPASVVDVFVDSISFPE